MTEGAPAGAERLDLRLPLLGLVVWAGCLSERFLDRWLLAVVLGVTVLAVTGLVLRRRSRPLALICAALFVVAVSVTALRVDLVDADRLDTLVGEGRYLEGQALVTSDPIVREGRFSDFVVVRLRLTSLNAGGQQPAVNAPLLAFAPVSWQDVELGSTVLVSGRFSSSEDVELAGTVAVRRPPVVVRVPPGLLVAAGWLRQGIREASSTSPAPARDLVPALVVGDDARLADEVVGNFRTSGLTHLTAVSGTNLTLVVGFLLVIARFVGVRGRLLGLVGAVGVAGFVLAARPEPSVLRAAVMGTVALAGMWSGSVNRGVRALGAAILVLLLLDPWLAVSVGFALSTLATAGILLLVPPLANALARWLPPRLAEALAVPFAAQLACTPLVAAISGQVSVVAVAANLLAGIAVGPATVLGMLGGVLVPVVPALGHLVGRLAGGCADWILFVADRASGVPGAAVAWPTDFVGLLLITALCALGGLVAPSIARRPLATTLGLAVVAAFLLSPVRVGWAPHGWFFVMCDVGQGDGLVLRVGERAAVVIDTGTDPSGMGRCLDDLGVETVPLVVLTHFHADHIDGLEAVIDRGVGEIWVSGTPLPSEGAAAVTGEAARAGVPVSVPARGTVVDFGEVIVEVVSPGSASRPDAVDDGLGSTPNNASVVLAVTAGDVNLLLCGDVEPEAQRGLASALAGRSFDVLKVPHHGSSHQDLDFLGSLGARLALVSVGADNTYGHPDPRLIELLEQRGLTVARTDLDGAVALTWDGALRVVRRGRA